MIQVIKHRHSVRTFEKQAISLEDQKIIRKLCEELEKETGPFGHTTRLYFLENKDSHTPESKKVGMYGYVKNVPAYVTASTKNTKEGLVDLGFMFEKLILSLVQRGFGTVWLSGDFDNADLENFARQGDIVPVLSPVGYPGYKRSLKERFLRMKQEATDRKPAGDIFFKDSFDIPYPKEEELYEVLELVRIAPSALNKQPWRILVKDNKIHCYLERTENFPKQQTDTEMINIGIALRHITIGLDDLKQAYAIQKLDDAPRHNAYEYVVSVILN